MATISIGWVRKHHYGHVLAAVEIVEPFQALARLDRANILR